MDGFADTMIARGPTLAPDRETATGSLHALGLPSAAAATAFVEREPNNRAGVYGEHRICGFENLLGRTMWEFTGAAGEPLFLVIAVARDDRSTPVASPPPPSASLGAELRERLIVYGALTEPDGPDAVGIAVALQAPGRDEVVPLLRNAQLVDGFPGIEVHDWEFGGHR